MKTEIKQLIIDLAEKSPSEEICGFLYYDLEGMKLYPCENKSELKHLLFQIDPEDFLKCSNLGKIYAVYHSHILGTEDFSALDKECAEEYSLPLYLYSVLTKKFVEYVPPSWAPSLYGNPFIWGFFDCWSAIRIYFWNNYKILLKDFTRDESYISDSFDIVEDQYREVGFVKMPGIGQVQPGDLLVFSAYVDRPQHFAIFLGNSKIYHHPLGKLSISESMGSYSKKLKLVLRHKSLI